VAFLHPLYYDYPEDEEAYAHKDTYKFGDNMLVSPITEPVDAQTQLASKDIWLPAGEWIEWYTGKHLTGPGVFHRSFTLGEVPVYLKAGSIVPMQPEMRYTGEKPVDPLTFEILPFAEDQKSSRYSVYEDSGLDEHYTHSDYAYTPVEVAQGESQTSYQAVIGPVEGSYAGMRQKRAYLLRFDGLSTATQVTVNGKKLARNEAPDAPGWHYDADKQQLVILLAAQSVHKALTVLVDSPLR
jgi:alpha-glucosidase